MGALLPILLAIGMLASMLGLYSSQVGSMGVDQIMRDKQLTWSYNAAMAGLKEGVVSPIATNRLNFINGAIDPYNPASGVVKNADGNTVAMYQYIAFGGDPHRNEMGAFDAARLGSLTSIHPRYVAAVGTSCVSTSNHQPIANAVTVNNTDGTLSCSSGTKQTVTVFAKISMGTLVSSALFNNPIQWIRVWAGTNDTISTEGPRVWVPDYGMTTSFSFARAWQGGTEGTPGLQAADLYKVFVKSGATVLSSTWTAYDALGESSLSIPDASYTTNISTTPTVKFVFSGPMYFPSLYPSGQIVAAPPNVNYGGCFSDGNTTTQCNIYAQQPGDATPNVELEVYPALPSGTQVVTYGSLPEYVSSGGAARDNLYSLNIPADTVYDAWGNAASAFEALFKVGDVVTGDVCSTPESVTISANSTTQTYSDTTKAYTVTIASGVDNTSLTFSNGCSNTVTISSITSDETTINVTSGSVALNLPATSASYNTSGAAPKHYDLDCGDHDLYVTGTHTPSYGSYDCVADTCITPEAVSITSNSTTWTGSDTAKIYTVTVASGVDNTTLNFDNGCANTATIVSITSDETTANVLSGSLSLNVPALVGSYTISGAAPTHYDLNCDNHDVYVTGTHTPQYGTYDCTVTCPPTYDPLPSGGWTAVGTPTFRSGGYNTFSMQYQNSSLIPLGDGGPGSDIELTYYGGDMPTAGSTVALGQYNAAGIQCVADAMYPSVTQCENSHPQLLLAEHFTGCELSITQDMGTFYDSPDLFLNPTRLRFSDTYVTLTGYDRRIVGTRLEYCYRFQRSDTGATECIYPGW
ncbi:MAG: hypothetical protein QE263_02765 [Vampirovibrionales bacterium]|nr:hypothetical protein [Vampirovibrionales bacterium]